MPAAASPELGSTILRANTLAEARNHPATGPEHLLAALFDNASARAALAEFDVDAGRFEGLTADLIGQLVLPPEVGAPFYRGGDPAAFERVLTRARARVEKVSRTEVEGHDVVLALLDERSSKAAKVLKRLGVRKRRLTAYIDQGLTGRVRLPVDPADGDDAEGAGQPLPPALDAAAVEPFVPVQRAAPVRIGARDGRIVRVSDSDSALNASEVDFDRWREAVMEHLGELMATEGRFPEGTNHRGVRTRLEALDQRLRGTIEEVKANQFRVGQDILRLGGLVESYRSAPNDGPGLDEHALRDLSILQGQLMLGISKFENWADFQRDASAAPARGTAIRLAAAETLDVTVTTLVQSERNGIVDPELPATFRWIREGLDDPWEATREVVYGAVRSFENLVVFLVRTVIDNAKKTVAFAATAIDHQIASELLNRLAATAHQLSDALPNGWTWLRPLLEIVGKLHG